MRKFYRLFFALIFICFTASSQQKSIELNWLNTAQEYYNGGDFIANDAVSLSDGSTVVVGSFKNTVDFDPGPDTFTVLTNFQSDFFLARYSSQGKLLFAFGLTGTGNQPYASAIAVTADADDNIYVTGSFYGNINFDGGKGQTILISTVGPSNFMACYTIKGELKFAKNIIARSEGVRSIVLDKNKNIYVTGSFEGYDVDFDPGPNNTHNSAEQSDIFFAKYDSVCNFKFVNILEGKKFDGANKIALDKNNNILICGNFSSNSLDADPDSSKRYFLIRKSDRDLFFAKYDTSGKIIFATNIGNYKSNEANSIAVGTDNSFVLTGKFNGTNVDFDPSNSGAHLLTSQKSYDAFIAKYNANGSCIFAFAIGNGSANDRGVNIALDSNNNIFCTGEFGGKAVDFDPDTGLYKIPYAKEGYYYLAKYKYNGKILSAVALGGQSPNVYNNDFVINSLQLTQTGNTLIAGYFHDKIDLDAGRDSAIVNEPTNTMFVCRYNNTNNFLSEINGNNYYFYYSNTTVQSSAIDKAGNMYVCGGFTGRFDFDPGPNKYLLESFSDSLNSSYENAGFIAKYNNKGKLVFAKAIKGGETIASNIAVDDIQNIYITGKASNNTDFDPDNGVYYLNNKPVNRSFYYNFYLAKYNANGNIIFAKGNGTNSNFLSVNSLTINKKNIYIAGVFSDSLDFDPGPAKHVLDGKDFVGNMFLAKYDSMGNYVFANSIQSNDNVFGYGVINDLKFDTKDNIIFIGTFNGTNFDFDPSTKEFLLSSDQTYDAGFISKYKNNGTFISAIEVDGQDYSYSNFSHLVTDNSDNIYIGGSSRNIADFDPGPGKAFLSQYYEAFFASYNSQLQFRFLKGLISYGDFPEDNNLTSITLDKYNNIYVAGEFASQKIDCDPSPDSALLINKNYSIVYNKNLFIVKYDSLGNYIYSNQFTNDSAGSGINASILVNDDGTLYYSGSALGKINFATGNKKVYLHPTSVGTNMFAAQYTQTDIQPNAINIASVTKSSINNSVKVYPNPIKDKISVQLNNIEENSSTAIISLYDINGKQVQINQTAFSNHTLNTTIKLPQNLSAGNYFIAINVEGKIYYSDVLIK